MRPTFDRRLWILLFIISTQLVLTTQQQNIKKPKWSSQNQNHQQQQHQQQLQPAEDASSWSISMQQNLDVDEYNENSAESRGDNKFDFQLQQQQKQKHQNAAVNQKCAKKSCTQTTTTTAPYHYHQHADDSVEDSRLAQSMVKQRPHENAQSGAQSDPKSLRAKQTHLKHNPAKSKYTIATQQAHRNQHKELNVHRKNHDTNKKSKKQKRSESGRRLRRETEEELSDIHATHEHLLATVGAQEVTSSPLDTVAPSNPPAQQTPPQHDDDEVEGVDEAEDSEHEHEEEESEANDELELESTVASYLNNSMTYAARVYAAAQKSKRTRSTVRMQEGGAEMTAEELRKAKEPVIIIDDVEEFDSGTNRHFISRIVRHNSKKEDDYDMLEPRALPLRPLPPNPFEAEEMSVVYAEQHSEIRLMCEVDLDIAASTWTKNGQVVHAMDRTVRVTDYRFIKEPNGALTITNVMLEDDGKWQCEAENTRRYTENARPVKLVVLDRPKAPYLLIDSRRLDAGNIFVPVKENSELNLACISEGGNPKPTLTWEVLLSPGVDRHAQKVSAEVLELEEIKVEKDKSGYKVNSGAKSEARLPAVYRAHHNARILCVMEHPTLKIRQNASLLLDVQYTPSFAISRTPGFGYPLREGIEVSLKCDVDSNPPSTPRWQKDDGDTPVPQTGDGFLNFTSIRREHSGWYKCTSRHLNFQYSSIGYYLSVRYDSVDVTSEPDDQDISVAAASHNPSKGQLEVQLGGAVTLQCPQGSLGCWSHLDPVTARLRGLGTGLSMPTGHVSLKDVVYQDAGTYKCIGQSPANKKKLEVLQTVSVAVKGSPTVTARNATPVAYPGSPLHLAVEFCANPPAYAARWLHGDKVYTPGNRIGKTVLAYGVTDLPTPFCKEARLTYISMHERVPRTFYFIVSSPGGVAEAIFNVNFTMRYRSVSSNNADEEEEELSEPEEIHFPVFHNHANNMVPQQFITMNGLLWMSISCLPLLLRLMGE